MDGLGRDPEYDDSCYTCGAGYYFDVGMGPMNCRSCGGPLNAPQPPPSPEYLAKLEENADVLDDERYFFLDDVKAFRILRDLGRLEEALRPGWNTTIIGFDGLTGRQLGPDEI